MNGDQERAARAVYRMQRVAEAVIEDPNNAGAEEVLTAAVTEANRLLEAAGLFGRDEEVTVLVKELYPDYTPVAPRRSVRLSDLCIPLGPVHRAPEDPQDAVLGSPMTAGQREHVLRMVLARAGVTLGAHDDVVLRDFAASVDWATLATVAGWVQRADGPPADPAMCPCGHPRADHDNRDECSHSTCTCRG